MSTIAPIHRTLVAVAALVCGVAAVWLYAKLVTRVRWDADAITLHRGFDEVRLSRGDVTAIVLWDDGRSSHRMHVMVVGRGDRPPVFRVEGTNVPAVELARRLEAWRSRNRSDGLANLSIIGPE